MWQIGELSDECPLTQQEEAHQAVLSTCEAAEARVKQLEGELQGKAAELATLHEQAASSSASSAAGLEQVSALQQQVAQTAALLQSIDLADLLLIVDSV